MADNFGGLPAEKEVGGPGPAQLEIGKGAGEIITGQNPAGTTMGAKQLYNPEIAGYYKSLQDATDQYAQSLQQRYNQPNWFQIAAGFAKPQLGGFLASVGSASNAYGQQLEAQRAIAPTIAQLKMQVAASKLKQSQEAAAQERLLKTGVTGTASAQNVAEASAYALEAPSTTVGSTSTAATTPAQIISSILSGAEGYQKASSIYGKDNVDKAIGNYGGVVTGNQIIFPSGKTIDISGGNVTPTATKPVDVNAPSAYEGHTPGVPDKLIQNPNVPKWDELTANKSKAYNTLNTQYNVGDPQSNMIGSAPAGLNIYKSASTVYNIAQDPLLKPVLGQLSQGDLKGIIGTTLENVDAKGLFTNLSHTLERYYAHDPDAKKNAIAKLQSLETALGDLRGRVAVNFPNQTDLRTSIETHVVPTMANNQDSFLRGIATIGSKGLTQYELGNALTSAGKRGNFDAQNDWLNSPEYTSVMHNAMNRENYLMTHPAGGIPKFLQDASNYFKDYYGSSGSPNTQGRSSTRVINGKTWAKDPSTGEWHLQ